MRRMFLAAVGVMWMVSRAGAVDFGWQTVSGGGIEYIVQVEPDLIDSFRREGFSSDVPAGLRDIRRIRIEVGTGRLPNQGDLKGPTIAEAPARTEPKAADNSAPTPTETFGEAAEKATPPPSEVAGSHPGSAPPLLDSSRPVPPLPFFQSGPAKSLSSNRDSVVQAESRASQPNLKSNEAVPAAASERGGSERRTVEAGMPTAAVDDSETAANRAAQAAAPKPWGVLLLAVLGLFASLGANVYLVWIHQEVRAKYRMLAGRVGGGISAA